MQIQQFQYIPSQGWLMPEEALIENPDLILAFGSGKDCNGDILVEWWQKNFAGVPLLGCSTAGEILDTSVNINTMSLTAIKFEHAQVQLESLCFEEGADSFQLGQSLAQALPKEGLKLVFVLSDGMHVNGTQLVAGLCDSLPEGTPITGGLAGDGKRFEETQICVNENFGDKRIGVIGFYGDSLSVGYGSLGGWDAFGPDRLITKAKDNTLYQLDGQSALGLYKTYLGDQAKDLPASGLRFPLMVTTPQGKQFVRTLLAIDEESDSMTFAGDLPEGSYARLMKANFDRLIDGAIGAAEVTLKRLDDSPELAVLISCVGRKIVLEQRVEEEVEGVRSVLGDDVKLTGFYSYGEICPLMDEVGCTLHNQTMTITTLKEDS